MAVAERSGAGRPQLEAKSGPGYRLAEFMNQRWGAVPYTNAELAGEWNYKSPGIISMWRTGASRVPFERLGDIARLLNVDLAVLVPLWLDQVVAGTKEHMKVTREVELLFKRLATINEFAILKSLRNGASHKGLKDPVYTATQLQAFEQIAADDRFANFVLEEAKKQNMINEIASDED